MARVLKFNASDARAVGKVRDKLNNLLEQFRLDKKTELTKKLTSTTLLSIMTRIARKEIPYHTLFEYRKNQDIIDLKRGEGRTASELAQEGPYDGLLREGQMKLIKSTKRSGQTTVQFAHEYSETYRGRDDYSSVLNWINEGRKQSPSIDELLEKSNQKAFTVQSREIPQGIYFRRLKKDTADPSMNEMARAAFDKTHGELDGVDFIAKIKSKITAYLKENALSDILKASIGK